MKCNILHAALCLSCFLTLRFPLFSQQTELSDSSTLPKSEKVKPLTNREKNLQILEYLKKQWEEAVLQGRINEVGATRLLIGVIEERLKNIKDEETGRMLKGAAEDMQELYGYDLDCVDLILGEYAKKLGSNTLQAKSTGRTTGHIGNMHIKNAGKEVMALLIPVLEIPSVGEYQGYIVEATSPVTIASESTLVIPLIGYCTDVFSKPVPDGFDFPPFETWTVNTPMIETYYTAVETTTTIQETGEYSTPFTGDPTSEITTVVQNVIWLTDSPNGIYTFEEICTDITQQIETTTGRPVSTFTPGEYHTFRDGLDDLIEMINEVGVMAGIPSFVPSINIPEEFRPADFPTPTDNGIEYTITATGTGRTTGNIANITFTNPGKTPTTIQIGSGTGLFIPSSGQYQPYIVPSLPPVPIGPGETITVPVEGYCVDIHLPPVPSGGGMPGISDWYSVPPSTSTETTPGVITIPTKVTFPTDLARDILINNQPLVWSSLGEDCIPAVHQTTSTIPGTSKPIPGGEDGLFSTTQKPDVIVPIMLDAINRISIAYDEMKKENLITTPFSGNPDKEREAVIQQTFWRFTAGPEGKKYEKQNFQDNTIRQFEQNTGKDFESMPEPQKDKINDGADDFWDTFEAVGVEAKVLDVPPVLPDEPTTPPQDIWEDYDVGDTKATSANDDPPAAMPMPDDNVMLNTEEVGPHCKCGKISFTLNLPLETGTQQIVSSENKKEIEVENLKNVLGEIDTTDIGKEGPRIHITDIEVSCDCSLTGKCNFYPRNSQYAESDEGKATITSSTYNVYTLQDLIYFRNKYSGFHRKLKFKIHAWCKGDSCKETKDCFENFTITFKEKQK